MPKYVSTKPLIPSPNKTTWLLRRNHARCLGAVPKAPRTQPCRHRCLARRTKRACKILCGEKVCQNSTSQVPWVPRGYGIKYYSQLTYSLYSLTSDQQNRCPLYLHQRAPWTVKIIFLYFLVERGASRCINILGPLRGWPRQPLLRPQIHIERITPEKKVEQLVRGRAQRCRPTMNKMKGWWLVMRK